ncbi:MAG: molybdopterin-synthase adenylyltransferase MoeB [Xanthomonadaceae bacterium]|mgnify:CR=1 FL=1|nr:molybdopterin-synthase adenylyltransferase MoeB [Xanthomonadaceae bacterium]
MNDEQLLRYSRQIMLPAIDIEGQERLLRSSALIVGMGGLGSPAALYLAAAGVGELVLADFDTVELSNLQRQIVHDTASIGQLKVESAAQRLRAINPDVRIRPLAIRLDDDNLPELTAAVDVVLDGCDNFTTRHAVNAACVKTRTPLVSGAAIRFEGQLAVYRLDRPGGPCYNCLFPQGPETAETCSETGIIAPLTGVIGSLQALEAIKLLATGASGLDDQLLLFDAQRSDWRRLRIPPDPACPCCGTTSRVASASA